MDFAGWGSAAGSAGRFLGGGVALSTPQNIWSFLSSSETGRLLGFNTYHIGFDSGVVVLLVFFQGGPARRLLHLAYSRLSVCTKLANPWHFFFLPPHTGQIY